MTKVKKVVAGILISVMAGAPANDVRAVMGDIEILYPGEYAGMLARLCGTKDPWCLPGK